MASVGQDDETRAGTADLQLLVLMRQIEAMERPQDARRPLWPGLQVIAALVAIVALCVHGYSAYATIALIDANAKIVTANPVVMFQDLATNGPRVGSTVEASSRATYTRALEQFVLDGTGVVLGLALVVAGLFVRANL